MKATNVRGQLPARYYDDSDDGGKVQEDWTYR